LDVTLRRGRILIANPTDKPLKVRLRFDNPATANKGEVWDIILAEKGTEVVFTLWSLFAPGEPFFTDPKTTNRVGPTTHVQGYVQSGKAIFGANLNKSFEWPAQPEGQILAWDSRTGTINPVNAKSVPGWFFSPPQVDAKVRGQMANALEKLNTELFNPDISSVLVKALSPSDPAKAKLAIRCAAALDDIQRVTEVLGNSKDIDLRWEAIEALRVWITHSPKNEYVLYESLQPSYSEVEAANALTLLHTFSLQQLQDPNTYQLLIAYLETRKPALKELAHWHLCHLAPQG